jgi:hypothetical protein
LRDDLKIKEPVGWYTLRHSLGTLMKANGGDVKTIQETLRHANFKVTMDAYTQGTTEVRRNAHSRVVRQIMGTEKEESNDERNQVFMHGLCYRTFSNPCFFCPNSASCLFYWRPRRDLNPCYRRERRNLNRSTNKSLRTGMHR